MTQEAQQELMQTLAGGSSSQTTVTLTQCSTGKLDYIFESESQNKFHYDVEDKIFDYTTGKTVKDIVKILKSNSIVSTGNSIGYPITWQVVDTVNEVDGFQDNRKVKVGFYDDDDDDVVDNPEIFDIVVEPTLSESTKFVFFEKYTAYDTIERFRPYAASNFVVTENETSINLEYCFIHRRTVVLLLCT